MRTMLALCGAVCLIACSVDPVVTGEAGAGQIPHRGGAGAAGAIQDDVGAGAGGAAGETVPDASADAGAVQGEDSSAGPDLVQLRDVGEPDKLPDPPEVRPGADLIPVYSALPEACQVLSVFGTSARPQCKGNWPGTQYPCLYYCQPKGSSATFPDQETLWACWTFTPDRHENGGNVVCVGGGVVGCNTYCPE